MGPILQFVLAFLIGGTTLAGTSLLWPKMTTAPRPPFLTSVRQVVVSTPVGQQTALVLGVADEAEVAPINLGEAAASAASNVKDAVGHRVQTVVVSNAVNQLSRQFESLPMEQKKQIQEALCKSLEDK